MAVTQNLQEFFGTALSDEEIILLGLMGRSFLRSSNSGEMAGGMYDAEGAFLDYLKQYGKRPVRNANSDPAKPIITVIKSLAVDEDVQFYMKQFDKEKTPQADFEFVNFMIRLADNETPLAETPALKSVFEAMDGNEKAGIAYKAFRVLRLAGKKPSPDAPKIVKADSPRLG